MRITVMNLTNGLGGAEECIRSYISALSSFGHQCRIIVSNENNVDFFARYGHAVVLVDSPSLIRNIYRLPWYIDNTTKQLVGELQESKCDCLLCNAERGVLFFNPIKAILPNLRIFHYCHSMKKSNLLLRWSRKSIERVLCPSAVLKANIPYCLQNKAVLLPNGFNTTNIAYTERKLRSDKPLRIGMACVLVRLKSIETILNALAILKKKSIPVELHLAVRTAGSDMRYSAELDDLLTTLDLKDVYKRYENIDDIKRFFSDSDIVVSTTIARYGGPETFGRTVVEGWMAGCPVIASDCGGPAEIIRNEKTGLLFKAGDASDLADKIAGLRNDENKYLSLSRNGFQASKYYDVTGLARKLEAELMA